LTSGELSHVTGRTVITITGTDTFTSRMDAHGFVTTMGTGLVATLGTLSIANNTTLITSVTNSTAKLNSAGAWATATKKFTLTFDVADSAANVLVGKVTAYKAA
jgi:hypothetical protein